MYQLRELERKDIPTINRWRNDPQLIACLGAPFRFINEDVDNSWYDSYMRSRGSCVRCAIVTQDNEAQALGLISLTDINPVNRSAHLHIMIGSQENRGKGIGGFAVKAMLDHAFFNLNLRRIELGVLESNAAALRLYEKCGFVREGLQRQAVYKNGQYHNLILMSILREEYPQATARH